MKNSFIIFTEYEDKLKKLSDEQMGRLFRAIFEYERAGVVETELDQLTEMAFSFIASDLDRARTKYEKCVENGKKGGAPCGNDNAKKQPKTTQNNLKQPKTTKNNLKQGSQQKNNLNDNVDVNENDDVDVNENEKKSSSVRAHEGDDFFGHDFSPAMREKLLEWLAYKKERRKKYTPTGQKSLMGQVANRLKQYDEAQIIDLISECMANGWQGIIWDKLKPPDPAARKEPHNDGTTWI